MTYWGILTDIDSRLWSDLPDRGSVLMKPMYRSGPLDVDIPELAARNPVSSLTSASPSSLLFPPMVFVDGLFNGRERDLQKERADSSGYAAIAHPRRDSRRGS